MKQIKMQYKQFECAYHVARLLHNGAVLNLSEIEVVVTHSGFITERKNVCESSVAFSLLNNNPEAKHPSSPVVKELLELSKDNPAKWSDVDVMVIAYNLAIIGFEEIERANEPQVRFIWEKQTGYTSRFVGVENEKN